MRFRPLAIALASAVLFASPAARAQEDYPLVVQAHLKLGYAPPCSLCHVSGKTGSGTVVTPFGWAMRARGLVVEDETSVSRALDQLRADKIDSDGDGVPDVDELVAGTDPNSAGSVKLPNGEEPGYGCGGEAPKPGPVGGWVVPIPFGLALGAALRRRFARRPR